jgi:UDP-N-acetylmuramate dehydrogenase
VINPSQQIITTPIRGVLKLNEPMSSYTSWHIGGPADCYYQPADIDDLIVFLKDLIVTEPLTWLGLGSNVLVADQGIRGTVIHTQNSLGKIELAAEDEGTHTIRVEAGVPCAKIAKWCTKHALSGGEFFAGIPGTMGGALAMNAGAFGGETWSHIEKVEVINRVGDVFTRGPEDYQIAYRSVFLKSHIKEHGQTLFEKTHSSSMIHPSEWYTAAYLRFPKGDGKKTESDIKTLLRKRNESQPIGVFSCGSVFKNPTPDYAARLIEASGLKGYKVGDAQISPKHSNFIINLGSASAQNVLDLIQLIQAEVHKQHNILLHTEVRMLGF